MCGQACVEKEPSTQIHKASKHAGVHRASGKRLEPRGVTFVKSSKHKGGLVKKEVPPLDDGSVCRFWFCQPSSCISWVLAAVLP